MSSSVLPTFPSNSFIVSGPTFRSLIHFEFIFVDDVRKCFNFVLLHVAVQFSQHHLLKRQSLPHWIFLPPLSKKGIHRCMDLYLGFPFCSIGLYFCFHVCQYHTVLMTVALQYNLKSGRWIPPAPFFFLKTALAIWGLLCFQMNCEIFCSSSVKNAIGNLMGITLNLQIVFGNIVIHNIDSSYPRTWNISASVYVIFDFFHQCLIIFCVQVFCLLRQVYSQIFYCFCFSGEWDLFLNFFLIFHCQHIEM